MSTSHPPDIIHVKSVPRPPPFFAALPLPCHDCTERKVKNKKEWRPGNEASTYTVVRLLLSPPRINLYSGTPLFRTSDMRTSRFNGRFAPVRIVFPLTAIHYNP